METLLVIESHAQMRHLVRVAVRGVVQLVHECAETSQVLAAYALYQPDWVLLDIDLQERDGLAAARSLKNAFPDAKVIIVSGYGDKYVREAAAQAGACVYLPKEDLLSLRFFLRSQARVESAA